MISLFKVAMSPRAHQRVAAVLASGYIGQGEMVERFEAELQAELDLPRAPLTVSSCTHALDLAFHLIGIGPGDEVISTPITCTATNVHLVHRGARIVWADVDPVTGLIDPVDVARKTTDKTKAVVAVDWGGQLCCYGALRSLGVPVVQDAAHSYLSTTESGETGAQGDYVAWSFQAIKHLTTGDGGALLVPREEYARAKLLRWYGLDRESSADFRCAQTIGEVGYKYHMNDIAAAIGLANLSLARSNVNLARQNAAYYNGRFKDLPGVEIPPATLSSSRWLYTLQSTARDALATHLRGQGVASSLVHDRNDKHPQLAGWWPDEQSRGLPGVDAFCERQLSIPVGWWLSNRARARVADAVVGFHGA